MKAGVVYPQWAPDFYFGYGYPFFLFYAPGVHIAAAVLALLGLGVTRGLVALQALALLLYGTGAYLAARCVFDKLRSAPVVSMSALAAAALYVYVPLRMRELFSQGNLSQLVALESPAMVPVGVDRGYAARLVALVCDRRPVPGRVALRTPSLGVSCLSISGCPWAR